MRRAPCRVSVRMHPCALCASIAAADLGSGQLDASSAVSLARCCGLLAVARWSWPTRGWSRQVCDGCDTRRTRSRAKQPHRRSGAEAERRVHSAVSQRGTVVEHDDIRPHTGTLRRAVSSSGAVVLRSLGVLLVSQIFSLRPPFPSSRPIALALVTEREGEESTAHQRRARTANDRAQQTRPLPPALLPRRSDTSMDSVLSLQPPACPLVELRSSPPSSFLSAHSPWPKRLPALLPAARRHTLPLPLLLLRTASRRRWSLRSDSRRTRSVWSNDAPSRTRRSSRRSRWRPRWDSSSWASSDSLSNSCTSPVRHTQHSNASQ